MTVIARKRAFSPKEMEVRSDLDRLRMVLGVVPDEGVMRNLEVHRDKGRDDYPVGAVWNSLSAGVVYEHSSIESLRRELRRNGELTDLCGIGPTRGAMGGALGRWV